jgi:hypothetical protein
MAPVMATTNLVAMVTRVQQELRELIKPGYRCASAAKIRVFMATNIMVGAESPSATVGNILSTTFWKIWGRDRMA